MKEKILFGIKKGRPAWEEELITDKTEQIKEAKAWAIKEGYDRFRVATIDLSTPPDFTKTIKRR